MNIDPKNLSPEELKALAAQYQKEAERQEKSRIEALADELGRTYSAADLTAVLTLWKERAKAEWYQQIKKDSPASIHPDDLPARLRR